MPSLMPIMQALNQPQQTRRRKKRYCGTLKTVEVTRGQNGYGFTISGQQPCILSCIVSNSPADRAGLKTGDYLMAVNSESVAQVSHDDVVRLIGSSRVLVLQIAENLNDSDSSDGDYPHKTKYHTRPRMYRNDEVNRYPNHRPLSPDPGLKQSSRMSRSSNPPRKHTYVRREDRIDAPSSRARSLTQPPVTRITPSDLGQILYPSFQPHFGGGSMPASIKEYDVDVPIDSSDSLQCIVGYVGSIEMPQQAHLPNSCLVSIRSAIRKLRLERRVHTFVLMQITQNGIKLLNALGNTVAFYIAEKVAFSGACADDRKFFGLVTLHSGHDESVPNPDDFMCGSSCHVFMVDPELSPHMAHAQKARTFQIQCSVDPVSGRCLEFPRSVVPILACVTRLYPRRLVQPISHVRSVPNESNGSSAGDSGFGGRDHNRVCIVECSDQAEETMADQPTGSSHSSRWDPSDIQDPLLLSPLAEGPVSCHLLDRPKSTPPLASVSFSSHSSSSCSECSNEDLRSKKNSSFEKKQPDAEYGKLTKLGAISTSALQETNNKENISQAASWATGFHKLLQDPLGLATFTEFLKKEISEENILFWAECEKYANISSIFQRKLMAKELYDKHLCPQASEAVNVDFQARLAVEKGLDKSDPDLFKIAQNQIVHLMKTDSYPRFLKSDLYKNFILKKSKPSGIDDGDDRRRKMLPLPWSRYKSERQLLKGNAESENSLKRQDSVASMSSQCSLSLADLNLIGKESPIEGAADDDTDEKFCRVTFPDGSTTVIFAKNGQSVYTSLSKLCERRNLILTTLHVVFSESEKLVDMTKDVSSLASKELTLHQCILFRVDLPNRKILGVKARPMKTVEQVLEPILAKYGFKLEKMVLHMLNSGQAVNLDDEVSLVQNQRIIVQSIQDYAGKSGKSKEWGLFSSHRVSRLPLGRTVPQSNEALDLITNSIFRDLMEGRSVHQFDELGVLDPDQKELVKADEHRPSGILGFIRRNSVGEKDDRSGKSRAAGKLSSQGANNVFSSKPAKDNDEEQFLEFLSQVQSQRYDDQRGTTGDPLELPDFLKPRRRNSDSSVLDLSQEVFQEVIDRSMFGDRGELYADELFSRQSELKKQQPARSKSSALVSPEVFKRPSFRPGETSRNLTAKAGSGLI